MSNMTIQEYIGNQKGRLIGYFPVSFPVYAVQVEYDSVDSDPFYPLYKAILHYTQKDVKHENLSFFASVIGFERSLVETCVKHLKEEGMMRWHQDHYVVTADAEKKYLTANSRPTVRVFGSILVDGKDLSLLPDLVYSNKKITQRFDGEASPHLPVDVSIKIPQEEKLLRSLEKGPVKEKLHFEASGTNFSIVGYDKRFLRGANAVLFIDVDGMLRKEIVYMGESINCMALESPKTYTITMRNDENAWVFKANKGYNISSEKEMENLSLVAPNEGLGYVVQNRYKLPDHFVIKLEVEQQTTLPSIKIDDALLFGSQTPKTVIEDARRGYADFLVHPQGLIRLRVEHTIQRYVDFLKIITEWDKEGKLDGKVFIEDLRHDYPDWRKLLIHFKDFEILEAIDRACFISNRKEA